MEFWGQIRHGQLILEDRQAFDTAMAGQPEGLRLALSLRPRRRSRTANAYYWGVVLPMIAAALGLPPQELHEALKALHLGRWQRELAGQTVVCTRSTASLDSQEFAFYLRRVRAWAARELGLIIPLPPPPATPPPSARPPA